MNPNHIVIKNATQNNLKNVSLKIPKHKLVVVTGVSGSGKSSLAFDTLYAEGYRRYVENLSASAKFFLQNISRPKVEQIENLPPAIAIEQKSDSSNPRSTLGTATGCYHLLRALFAQYGVPHCPVCKKPLNKNDQSELLKKIKSLERGSQIQILAKWPNSKNQKALVEKLKDITSRGYGKVRIQNKTQAISNIDPQEYSNNENVLVLIDRIMVDPRKFDPERIIDSLVTAAKISKNQAFILIDEKEEITFSQDFVCSSCGFTLGQITPKNFSFNSPDGACGKCSGLGVTSQLSLEKSVPNKKLSITEGAILPLSHQGEGLSGYYQNKLEILAKKYRFSLNKPISKIPKTTLQKIFFAEDGLAKNLEKKYQASQGNFARSELEKYFSHQTCPVCNGKRLKKEFLAVKVFDKSIAQLVKMEIEELLMFFKKEPKNEIITELIKRLDPLQKVGLDYLSLDRSTQTLSGGESQRMRLSSQLYSGLSDVLYVLDEPTVGLHGKDTKKLIQILRDLQKNGNTVVVVEHDRDVMLCADHLIDVGPRAGNEGGKITFQGDIKTLKKSNTQTAKGLVETPRWGVSGTSSAAINRRRPTPLRQGFESQAGPSLPRKNDSLTVHGATQNNLKNVTVEIPLRKMICFAGVSGSGKSSLVNDILAKELRNKLNRSSMETGAFKKITGLKNLNRVVIVDQSSIGKSPRSNVATYTGIFDPIRKLFATTEIAKKKRFTASHFSFNMRGGRCEYCQGEGAQKVPMYLLENVYAPCPHCEGTRYNKKMLAVQYHGANIVDVLNMSVEYAYHFFSSHDLLSRKLKTMMDIGLGYLRLGQTALELSGGEAQRIRLAEELSKKNNGNNFYILDEPTVGLHFSDVQKLIKILHTLVANGNSVVVVEHNTDVISASDWIVELGPDGGKKGGEIIFTGTPEQLAKADTATGKLFR